MSVLTHEAHLHLYGCLSAEDLWDLLPDRLNRFPNRVEWYKSEFQRLTGQTSDPGSWAGDPGGFSKLKDLFLCARSMSFSHFQARFNLLIALFPPDPDDLTLANRVFTAHSKSSGIKEYRTFLPLYLPEPERERYLRDLIEAALSRANREWQPRFAVSFLRGDHESRESWNFLRDFLKDNPTLAPWVTGIDFCGFEHGHPPSGKKSFFRDVFDSSEHRESGLDILYHVGEMWDDIALHSAARWCVESLQYGVRRLGHALALGLDPRQLHGHTIRESAEAHAQHARWLRANARRLHEFGFGPRDTGELLAIAETNVSQGTVLWQYDSRLIELTLRFQDALMAMARSFDPVIECCPASNIRIGGISDSYAHPIGRFIKNGLRVVVATDDPGIFAVSLEQEQRYCREKFGLDDETFSDMNELSRRLLTTRDVFSRHHPRL